MNLITLLEQNQDTIVAEAAEALARARLPSYEASGAEENTARLRRLFELTHQCLAGRDLIPMLDYARQIARERFESGFDLREVQTGFNVLEEVVWKYITAGLAPEDYPQAFGLTSTVLGAGKEALAVEYVSLASHHLTPSLNMSALFRNPVPHA